MPSPAAEAVAATATAQPEASTQPPATPKRSFWDTDAGTLTITEILPGEAYDVHLGDAVLFRTSVGDLMENPSAYPGVVPEIIGAFRSTPPFDEVVVVTWASYGNACETSGFTFISITSGGLFSLANLHVCSWQDVQIEARPSEARIIIPPEPAGMRHGQMYPLIPGDEWVLQDGQLRHVRKVNQLLPHQVVEDD